MAKQPKRITAWTGDRDAAHTVEAAIALVKANAKAKFDESIEISVNLGVDPRHADQQVRGVVNLPSGTGRDVRVAVFAKDAKAAEATAAGAEHVGGRDVRVGGRPGVLRRLRRGPAVRVAVPIARIDRLRVLAGLFGIRRLRRRDRGRRLLRGAGDERHEKQRNRRCEPHPRAGLARSFGRATSRYFSIIFTFS